jgi:hypothetical protein
MAVAVDELLAIVRDETLFDGRGEARKAMGRLCTAFRES